LYKTKTIPYFKSSEIAYLPHITRHTLLSIQIS